MQVIRGRAAVKTTEATIVAAALFVSLFVLFIFPVTAHAQAVPSTGTTNEAPADNTAETGNEGTNEEAEPTVEAPGTPVVSSDPDDRDVVWEWTPPRGGTTPDAVVDEPGEPSDSTEPTEPIDQPTDPSTQPVEEPPVTQYPTDIIKYGYELTKQDVVVDSGEVESTVYTVTTNVKSSGNYTLKLWSINRLAQTSDAAYGYITIVNPVIPSFPPLEIPQPIDATIIEPLSEINDTSTVSAVYNVARTSPVASAGQPENSQNVLSSTDSNNIVPQADIAAVVKPSNQGWVIAGLPWYVWLLAAAVVFTAWRWVATTVKARQ